MQTPHYPGCDSEDQKNPFAKTFKRVLTPFDEFVHKETSSGIVLMLCALAAVIIANSPLYHTYDSILHTPLTFGGGVFSLTLSLHHWINDGAMVLFFFVVGLEVKREILIGELSTWRQSFLPLAAAFGGMIFPALCYLLFNATSDSINGWGIPMATDIAFALGVVALLGKRVPATLLPFLLALAIVDDLGAILVIAVFYTETIHVWPLAVGAACLGFLVIINLAGIRRTLPYLFFGCIMWVAMLKSGVHATLAGVITAFVIPAKSSCNSELFAERMSSLIRDFISHISTKTLANQELNILRDAQKQMILGAIEDTVRKMESPLQKLESGLHTWVAYVILPAFAFANAGIPIDTNKLALTFQHPVTLGIIFGLIIGKTVGIFSVSWLVTATGLARLPEGLNLKHIFGVALLTGIGFTMSIFIGSLAFANQDEYLLNAKIGIVTASLIAGIAGYIWLRQSLEPEG